MTRAVTAVAATLLVVVSGCGGGGSGRSARTTTTTAPNVAPDEACRLLTPADAAKLFGEQPRRV